MLFSIRALRSTTSKAPSAISSPGMDKKEEEKAKEQQVIHTLAIDHNNTETEDDEEEAIVEADPADNTGEKLHHVRNLNLPDNSYKVPTDPVKQGPLQQFIKNDAESSQRCIATTMWW